MFDDRTGCMRRLIRQDWSLRQMFESDRTGSRDV